MTPDWMRLADETAVASPGLLIFPDRVAENLRRNRARRRSGAAAAARQDPQTPEDCRARSAGPRGANPAHIRPTVALHDRVQVVRENRIVAERPVAARARRLNF